MRPVPGGHRRRVPARPAVVGLALAGAFAVLTAAVPLALLVRAGWTPLVTVDSRITHGAERAVDGSAALLSLARLVTRLGDPLLMTVLALLVAGLLWRASEPRLAGYVLLSRFGAVVLSQGFKHLVGRPRPAFAVPVDQAGGTSYPSGHALGSAAAYATLVALLVVFAGRSRWWVALLVLPVLVAASRVLLGVHYLSDVVGGLLLGTGWVALCTAAVLWRGACRDRRRAA